MHSKKPAKSGKEVCEFYLRDRQSRNFERFLMKANNLVATLDGFELCMKTRIKIHDAVFEIVMSVKMCTLSVA